MRDPSCLSAAARPGRRSEYSFAWASGLARADHVDAASGNVTTCMRESPELANFDAGSSRSDRSGFAWWVILFEAVNRFEYIGSERLIAQDHSLAATMSRWNAPP